MNTSISSNLSIASRWIRAAAASAALVGVVAGCSVKDTAVKQQAVQENQGLSPAIMKQPDVNAYFQAIGDRIVQAAKQADAEHVGPKSHFTEDSSWMFNEGVQFHLVNSKTLNAFTTGGTHVYIYNELFQKCQSEDALAAVMSHEFAHIYCRHVAAGMKRQQGMLGLIGVGAAAGYAAGGSQNGATYAQSAAGATAAAAQFVGMGFTRGDENQADEFGFVFYCRAGWNPPQFADFFQKMIQLGYDTTPEYASDHPTLAIRVQHTKERLAAFQKQYPTDPFTRPDIATPAQYQQYQQLAAQVAASTPDDSSLQQAQKLLNAFPSCVAPVSTPEQQEAQHQVVKQAKAQ